MASFFQPGSHDPVQEACGNSSLFQVYCNSILPTDSMFGSLYQLVILVLGVTCIVVPCILYLIYLLFQRDFSFLLPAKAVAAGYALFSSAPISTADNDGKSSTWSIPKGKGLAEQGAEHHGADTSALSGGLVKITPAPSFRSTKSFCLFSGLGDSGAQEPSKEYDLVVIPVMMSDGVLQDSDSLNSSLRALSEVPAKLRLSHVLMEDFGHQDHELIETAQSLALALTVNNLTGLALECTATQKGDQINYLLSCLMALEVPVILLCQHDCEAIDHVDFSLASGVILKNACILPDGERRDYFRARRLRDTMARCSVQRDKRPDFFVGFLDRWETRPKASVIRRAAKIAEHFGAVFEHGPIDSAMGFKSSPYESGGKTLSAFEFLRRSEMIEVRC